MYYIRVSDARFCASSFTYLLVILGTALPWQCLRMSQGRNHVFKVGVQFLGLGYCTEQSTDGIANFVHCRVQLRKKLGWSIQILGVRTPDPPVVAPLLVGDISPIPLDPSLSVFW